MPGRVIFSLVLLFLLVSCNNNHTSKENTTLTEPKKLVSELDTFYGGQELMCLRDTTETVFKKFFQEFKRDTSEAVNIKPYADVVKRGHDSLTISFSNGKSRSYVNESHDEDGDFTQYYYYGKIKTVGYHVI